jgi:hypothetical protein
LIALILLLKHCFAIHINEGKLFTTLLISVHYDLFRNFFIQIIGHKKVIVFPPSQWEQLYLFPILHPGGRSAQVNNNRDFHLSFRCHDVVMLFFNDYYSEN